MKAKLRTGYLKRAACLLGAASVALAMAAATPAELAQAAAGGGDTVTVGSASQLAAFRDAVNAGDTYAGKTVRLSHDLTLSGTWTPIGTAAHPFEGTFDGGGHAIAGLQVSGTADVGFFGRVGVGGKIENLRITNGDDDSDPSTVTAASGSQVVRNVGSIAGYVYGTAGGTAIENCSSAATVTVTSTLKAAKAKSGQFTPEGAPAEGSSEALGAGATDGGVTIERVGGVVGYSASGITGTSYTGALSATTHENPMSSDATYVGSTVGGIAGQVGGYSTTREVGSSGRALTIAHYPQKDGSYAQETEAAATLSGCANSGTLAVTADGNGGKDRFGADASAAFANVGGIVGNSFASIVDCANDCDVDARTSAATGGVAGTLRGSTYTGTSTVLNDAGEQFSASGEGASATYTKTSTGPTLVISKCTNRASVTGLAQVGGILGEGGTHTRVEFSKNVKNGSKDQAITGTRWNKPMPGGIAGLTHGDVTHCYNRVDVVTQTGGGYFASGLVGMLGRYTVDAGNAADSPVPEMDACYSTGTVQASGAYRQSGICGQNEGSIHDCYMLEGSVLNVSAPDSEQPYRPMVAENDGSVAATVGTATGTEMKGKPFCGKVNASTTLAEYRADEGFLPDISDEDRALNDGYPVFGYERAAAETDGDRAMKEQLNNSGLSARGIGHASYQANGNPVPTVQVSYNGAALVQGADYYVIPDASAADEKGNCKNVSEIDGADLEAHIVGIGDYCTGDTRAGSLFTAPYKVGKGQFGTCSAAIKTKEFDYLPHYPSKADITVTDSAGNVVPGDQFDIPGDPGTWANYHVTYESQSHDGKSHVGYELKITAGANSNYEGDLYGYFQIKKAELFRNEKTEFEGFELGGQKWSWSSSHIVNGKAIGGYLYQKDGAGAEQKGMKAVYTGEPIKPKALSMRYLDGNGTAHMLKEGSDYRVVYGDPGRDDLISTDTAAPNVDVGSEESETGKRPCVTVRYVPGNSHDFTNYQNFFFEIVPADVGDPAQATVTADAALDADSVVVKGRTGATIPADNYTVSRTAADGKATLTVTGKNNLRGSKTLVADVGKTEPVTPAPAPTPGPGSKTVKAKTFAKSGVTYKVTGAKTVTATKVARSAKSAKIPATVTSGKKTYQVTAIGATAAKDGKRLARLTIGKNVRTIGKQAFYGCKKLKSVTIQTKGLGKKSIGSGAFAKTAAKAKVKAPKSKVKSYKKYLRKAGLSKKATVRN